MAGNKVGDKNDVNGSYDIVERLGECKKVVEGDTRRETTGGIWNLEQNGAVIKTGRESEFKGTKEDYVRGSFLIWLTFSSCSPLMN